MKAKPGVLTPQKIVKRVFDPFIVQLNKLMFDHII